MVCSPCHSGPECRSQPIRAGQPPHAKERTIPRKGQPVLGSTWLNAPQLEKSTDAWAAFSRSAPSRFGVTRGQFSKEFRYWRQLLTAISQAPSRWKAKAPLRTSLKGAASHERQRACYATQPRTGLSSLLTKSLLRDHPTA